MAGRLSIAIRTSDDRDVAKARKARERVRREAHARERGRTLRGHEQAGGGEHRPHRSPAGVALEIQAPGLHAFVQRVVPAAREALQRIAFGRLDLRDGGAERAQSRARHRTGHVEGGSDDADAVERSHGWNRHNTAR